MKKVAFFLAIICVRPGNPAVTQYITPGTSIQGSFTELSGNYAYSYVADRNMDT